jgi:hypothetical protein
MGRTIVTGAQRRTFDNGRNHTGRRRSFKRALAGEYFVEHQAKRENVAARVDFLSGGLRLQLLGGHVVKRGYDLVVAGERHGESGVAGRLGRLPDLCEAEVEQLDASFGHQNVCRLQRQVRPLLIPAVGRVSPGRLPSPTAEGAYRLYRGRSLRRK